jgi:hypothetical protein
MNEFSMKQQQGNHADTPAPVSSVTKHIRIYSDNPIHDCIDRIINACVALDEGGEDEYSNAIALTYAAKDLQQLMLSRFDKDDSIHQSHRNEKRPN